MTPSSAPGEGLAERRLPERIDAYEAGGRQPGRWVLAIDLQVGDKILRRDGQVSALDSVEVDEIEEAVYNFRVFELPNYAVGACGILVHNENQGLPNAPKAKLDLMGGSKSQLGPEWTNYDLAATEGIADDVANLGKNFKPGELGEVVANNPRAVFLEHVSPLVESNGTVTVRGTMSNKFFKQVWEGKASGMDGFEVVSKTENVPKPDWFRQTDGVTPVQGNINGGRTKGSFLYLKEVWVDWERH